MAGSLIGRGRYAEAISLIERSERAAVATYADGFYVNRPGWMRFYLAYALEGSEQAARDVLERLESEISVEGLSSRSEAWSNLMLFHALAGNVDRAAEMFEIYGNDVPPEERGWQYRINSTSLEAFRALGVGDYSEAASGFDILLSEIYSCTSVCFHHALRGTALESAGRKEDAVAQYEAHLMGVPLTRSAILTLWTPTVMERLAGLYAEQGDAERAVEILESLVARYSDGDGPFLAYVNRAQRRLGELRE